MDSIAIRNTVASDLPRIPAIQTDADELFRTIGVAATKHQTPLSLEELSVFHEAGHAWVATVSKEGSDSETAIAYILVYVVDNDEMGWKSAFILRVSVCTEYSRRGIGKALIEHVALWASQHGMSALDMTTLKNVPWNQPYFERLGFQVVDEEELLLNRCSGLRRTLVCEWHETFLASWTRVAMRRLLILGAPKP